MVRACSFSTLRHRFLKKWITGLQICGSTKKYATIMERRKVIKLSADLAMATVRNGTSCWSRALIATASQNQENRNLVHHLLGTNTTMSTSDHNKVAKLNHYKLSSYSGPIAKKRICTGKKISKRSRGIRKARKLYALMINKPDRSSSSMIAKRLVKKRTQLLKNLVPGGQLMDDVALIEETLDYIISLRAQVDVMRSLARATELVN